ncbi:hypothetical protein [Pleionea litopenaei]|uniref:Uncharacterized protein n=1 Tax=Pleionea litopenaei TaxID=3070815 RepID=A0AA51RWE7_9GAMM|nr:hypothetical protein [Pleionea sp. HL-JVS1]WMS88827.1 hypothetical protein Q9312_07885 [Pleionea sp. HL-JVS1]
MNQYWEIWYAGARKGFMLQKLERVFGKKAISILESSGELSGRKINILKFELELSGTDWSHSVLESLAIAEKLNHSWSVSGVTYGEICATGSEEGYEVSDIVYASWKLYKAT